MNIHPLFVHFPIGILVLYTAFEILRFKLITKQSFYFPLKAILVIVGVGTGFLALSTGEMAEHIVLATEPSKRALIQMHSMFAGATISIYGTIAGYYLVTWLQRARHFSWLWQNSLISKLLKMMSYLVLPLALIGLVSITITGGLGGAIAYNPEVDPIVSAIYHLFF